MSSEYGNALKISIFGESHGRAIGVTVDGLPAGETIDMDELQRFLDRRRPGGSALVTGRSEADRPEFLSGLYGGFTTGFPVCAVIRNTDMRSADYEALAARPRPSHADYAAFVKYGGRADLRGGGHFSGRLTAPLCIAGGMALQLLKRRGIAIGAHLLSIGPVQDEPFPLFPTEELFLRLSNLPIPTIDPKAADLMAVEVQNAAAARDSAGGVIECAATSVPQGLGGPLFGGLEGRMAQAVFGIPGIKGVDFGAGFDAARLRGSAHNDPFVVQNGEIRTKTNRHGGILGGITSGMPVVFRAAVKPTPSIGIRQETVDLQTLTPAEIEIAGRHDPCIALRAVPVVEAAAAICLLDMLLEEGK